MIAAQIERLTEEEQRSLELASLGSTSFLANVCAGAADLDPQEYEDRCEKLARRNRVIRALSPQELPDVAAI